jgi:hypothetical protein
MRINWRKVLKREAFFLKTGKLSRRRHLVKPIERRCRRPTIATRAKMQLAETVAKYKDEPTTSGQSDLNLVLEVPLSTKLEALRR